MSKRQLIKTVIRIMRNTDNITVLRDMCALIKTVDRCHRKGDWTV